MTAQASQAALKNSSSKPKWSLKADYLQACNCDYGCPCEFEAPPTTGCCEGMGAWQIRQGSYSDADGEVKLDGLAFGFAARWPKAIHLGNGVAAMFYDERANVRQRQALLTITSGQAGGMPFEAIVTTFSTVHEPRFVPFVFSWNGKQSSVKIGSAIRADMEPITNPVTGKPEGIRVEHETGFIFKSAECVSAKEMSVSAGEGLNFNHPSKCGFVTQIEYGNG